MPAARTYDPAALPRLTTAFRALALSGPPGDWQSGASSTVWAPMATAIATETTGKAAFHRCAVYGHVIALIRQAEQQVAARVPSLGPTEYLQMRGFFAHLLPTYLKLEDDAKSEHATS